MLPTLSPKHNGRRNRTVVSPIHILHTKQTHLPHFTRRQCYRRLQRSPICCDWKWASGDRQSVMLQLDIMVGGNKFDKDVLYPFAQCKKKRFAVQHIDCLCLQGSNNHIPSAKNELKKNSARAKKENKLLCVQMSKEESLRTCRSRNYQVCSLSVLKRIARNKSLLTTVIKETNFASPRRTSRPWRRKKLLAFNDVFQSIWLLRKSTKQIAVLSPSWWLNDLSKVRLGASCSSFTNLVRVRRYGWNNK